MPIKSGSFIVSPEQLSCVYTDLPTKVESEYAYIDKKINESDINYIPKFMDQFNDVMIHAKSKECCLLMLLDQSIVGS